MRKHLNLHRPLLGGSILAWAAVTCGVFISWHSALGAQVLLALMLLGLPWVVTHWNQQQGVYLSLAALSVFFGVFLFKLPDPRAATEQVEEAGSFLAMMPLGGILGSGIAGVIGSRFGWIRTFVVSLLIFTAACFVMARANSLSAMVLAMLALGCFELFVMTYYIATSTRLESSGRWATFAGGMTMLPTGWVPAWAANSPSTSRFHRSARPRGWSAYWLR